VAQINLKNALTQHLQSLHRFGVDELMIAKEGLSFDFSDTVEAAETAPKMAADTTLPRAKPAAGQPDAQPATADKVAAAHKKTATPKTPAAVQTQPRLGAPSGYQGQSQSREQREQSLSVIKSEVESCEACYELCRSRTKTVFGVGNPESKIVFLGEGPGANEDRQGEPFVAEAGKLLDKILTASTLGRDQVYILNTVKCRPPNNRNPLSL
jgi:DNA polymerase